MIPLPDSRVSSFAPPAPRRGFTLLELLVVISVITVLAMLTMTTIGMIRGAALAAACQNNLRQVGMALEAYRNDSEGLLPPPYHKVLDTDGVTVLLVNYGNTSVYAWYGVLPEYMDSSGSRIIKAAICPRQNLNNSYRNSINATGVSFGYTSNTSFAAWVATQTKNYLFGFNPEKYPYRKVALLAERWGWNADGSGPIPDQGVSAPYVAGYPPMDAEPGAPGGLSSSLRVAHRGKSAYLFLDNRVQMFKPFEQTFGPDIWVGR